MSQARVQLVTEAEAGQRLDRWLKHHLPELGYGVLQKLLRTGQVRVDGHRAKPAQRLSAGQGVRLPPLEISAEPRAPKPVRAPAPDEVEALRALILYQDDWVIALNKPSGLAVQGGSGQHRHLDAMLDALRFEARERPRLVHRLDKDTSGVLLLARSAAAARALGAGFQAKTLRKVYWAAVVGVPRPPAGLIDQPLAKSAGADGRERVRGDRVAGAPALTYYQLAAQQGNLASWLVLAPITGRTHQLRVHCAAIGHPILGDGKYGGRAAHLPGFSGQLQLHAREIVMPHPADGTTLRITAPLPAHMAATWRTMKFEEKLAARAERALERLIAEGAAQPQKPQKRK